MWLHKLRSVERITLDSYSPWVDYDDKATQTQVGIVASTVIDTTPFCIFTVDSILLHIELFRKAPSWEPGPSPETFPSPTPDASAPTANASSHTAPPISSPASDPEDGLAVDLENSTDKEIEMEDTEDWSVVDIDSSNKKNNLTVVEYIDNIYAYYKKVEEKLMVNALQFNMTVPTTYVFMRRFLKASQPNKKVKLVSFFLIDLYLVEYKTLRIPPSMLATAAVFTTSALSVCPGSGTQPARSIAATTRIRFLVGKLTSVHRKYNTSKYGNATRCELIFFVRILVIG
ncbi:hypothetical protein T459_02872 [Capsicum annuum]|uniref:Uncharacterized protein n=1 Tax=Capsicum annuum TaxID=4072 RepID=A0A2G3ALA1_CAPAN|nr:hypothetical protein T459_02872 [Capsicum annuum]